MYEEEEDQIVGSYAIFFAEGESLAKQGDYKKAIESLTKALEFKNDDQPCLVARSKCYLQLGNTKMAFEDAELSLKEDTKYHRGLYQKAEALYQMGDFEYALMFYHRGNKVRPDLQEFKLGIQKAQEAINNSVGTPDTCKLENKGDLSFFKQQDAMSKKKSTKMAKARAQAKAKEKEPVASQRTMKELLGEMYADREYLEELQKDPGLVTNRKDRSLYDLVQDGITYLDTRTEFWRQQKPIYARKREKELKKWRPPPTKPQDPMTRSRQGEVEYTKYIWRALEDIENAGDARQSLMLSEKALNAVNSVSEDSLPNKLQYVAMLHSHIGTAQMELGNVDLAMEQFEKDMEIANAEDYSDARSRALYNIGRAHISNGDYQQGLAMWLKRVPLMKSPDECAWLYHEIGRAYWEMKDYREAKEYGEKSLSSAHNSQDHSWQLNASMLIAQAEVKLGELTDAVGSFKTSLDLAVLAGDNTTQDAIKNKLDSINEQLRKEMKEADS